ncbi:MAG: acyloxyacyl hydrolase [Alphaproteobacteria bacterium]|nr:acyloxyacyl hydrolase [Alphaproteobacteria bacterium]
MRQALFRWGIMALAAVAVAPPVDASGTIYDLGPYIAQLPPSWWVAPSRTGTVPLPAPAPAVPVSVPAPSVAAPPEALIAQTREVPPPLAPATTQGRESPPPPPRLVDQPRVVLPVTAPDAGPRGPLSRPAPPPPGAKVLWPPIAGHVGRQVSQLERFVDRPPWVSEIRTGIMLHDIGLDGRTEEGGFDFNGELLFQAPAWMRAIGAPRPHLGANVNSDGDTSLFYAGLTWTAQFSGGVFFEGSLGAALHDGVEEDPRGRQRELGCRVLARVAVTAGYLFDGGPHSLSLMLEHVDNLGACDRNEGLDNFGMRYGYRF